MRQITDLQNVVSPGGDYPFGRVRDRAAGQNNGTPVNEAMVGDLLQFANKLMDVSENLAGGDAPNGLPDNDYNGFQIYEAFSNIIIFAINLAAETVKGGTTFTSATPLLVNNWIQQDGGGTYHELEYYKDPWGWVHLRGKVQRSNSSDGTSVLMLTLPSGYRPTKQEDFVVSAYSVTLYSGAFPVGISIEADGKVTPYEYYAYGSAGVTIFNNPMLDLSQPNDYVCLDGIRFFAG